MFDLFSISGEAEHSRKAQLWKDLWTRNQKTWVLILSLYQLVIRTWSQKAGIKLSPSHWDEAGIVIRGDITQKLSVMKLILPASAFIYGYKLGSSGSLIKLLHLSIKLSHYLALPLLICLKKIYRALILKCEV